MNFVMVASTFKENAVCSLCLLVFWSSIVILFLSLIVVLPRNLFTSSNAPIPLHRYHLIRESSPSSHCSRNSSTAFSRTTHRDLFKDWNKTPFLSFRKRVAAVLNITQILQIYHANVKTENMYYTDHSTTLNQTYSIGSQQTCALIGNGGILLNSCCGDEIDRHDFVLRNNLPPLTGYEDDVDRKKKITTNNEELIMRFAKTFLKTKSGKETRGSDELRYLATQRLRDLNGSILWHPLASKGITLPKFQQIVQRSRDLGIVFQVGYSPKPLKDVSKKFWQSELPSSGLRSLKATVTFCDKISLYGYWPFHKDLHGRALQHHYYENVQFNFNDTPHKMNTEFAELTRLHK